MYSCDQEVCLRAAQNQVHRRLAAQSIWCEIQSPTRCVSGVAAQPRRLSWESSVARDRTISTPPRSLANGPGPYPPGDGPVLALLAVAGGLGSVIEFGMESIVLQTQTT